MTRIKFLDGWRGSAILAVLVGHFAFEEGINLGRFGVELFFVLSGRLMAEILFVESTSLKVFFPRRFARVYPALFFFTTFTFVGRHLILKREPDFAQYLSAITLTANYSQFWTPRSDFLDHIWSLCIEEHMYILLGLVAFVHRRFSLPLIPILTLLSVAAMINGLVQTERGLDYYLVYWRSDVRGASILISAAIFLQLKKGIPAYLKYGALIPILFILALVANFNLIPDPVKYSFGTICLALCLSLLSFVPIPLTGLLENRFITQIGLYSYSLYLWQQPFFKHGYDAATRLPLLPLAIIAGLGSFYIIEQPARRYINVKLTSLGSRVPTQNI